MKVGIIGTGAVGAACAFALILRGPAREIVLRDERAVLPIGSFNPTYGVTLSLPGILGRHGVAAVLPPAMSPAEQAALQLSAETLRRALDQAGGIRN